MLIVLLISLFQLITCNNEKIQFDVNDHIAHNQSPNILSNFINDKNSYNSSVRSIPLNHQLSSELIPSFNKITFPHYRFYLLSNLELNNRYELRLCFPAIVILVFSL
ncbi:hypothetical protein K502DRAFT_322992 [Neoconidiobolus thromboides FSU 785]|nr:hypothetical protein K502DRAFT_322992 [Neoconidiobolus thromboides FSU 785]